MELVNKVLLGFSENSSHLAFIREFGENQTRAELVYRRVQYSPSVQSLCTWQGILLTVVTDLTQDESPQGCQWGPLGGLPNLSEVEIRSNCFWAAFGSGIWTSGRNGNSNGTASEDPTRGAGGKDHRSFIARKSPH